MCWPTSAAPAPPTDLPRRSMDDWNTCAARPSGSATSPTTSHDRSSRPADSDPTYTLDPDEPLKGLRYRLSSYRWLDSSSECSCLYSPWGAHSMRLSTTRLMFLLQEAAPTRLPTTTPQL